MPILGRGTSHAVVARSPKVGGQLLRPVKPDQRGDNGMLRSRGLNAGSAPWASSSESPGAPAKEKGQARETLLRSRGILSVLNRGLLRDQSRNEGSTQPFLIPVGTPLPFDNQHSVDVARGESPKNVSRFFFVEPPSQPVGLDEKGYGGSLGAIPTAFFFPLDCRQF
jgi:hypothetical protein